MLIHAKVGWKHYLEQESNVINKDISEPDKIQTDKSFANDKKFIITAAENLCYPKSCINKLKAAKTLGEMNIIMVTARKEREANEKSNV